MSDEFKIIDTEEEPAPNLANTMKKRAEMVHKNQMAEEWSKSTGLPMIKYTRDLDELEKDFEHYMSFKHELRERSDEESIRIYGYDNEYRYENLKNELMAMQNRSSTNLYVGNNTGEVIVSDTPIKESVENDAKAAAWSKDANIPIILDSDMDNPEALKLAYERYMSTDYYNRKKSDFKSFEIYGANNIDRYNIANKILAQKIDHKVYNGPDSEYEEYEGKYDVDSDEPMIHEASNLALSKVENIASDILFNKMKDIEYGFYDTKTRTNLRKTNFDLFESYNYIYSNWKLLRPMTLKRYGCGLVYDCVEFERYEMEKAGIKTQSYFIAFTDYNKQNHAFLTFEDNGKFYWMERDWYKHWGLHKYDSLEDLLSDVADKFIEGDASKINDVFCRPYPKPTKYNMSMKEFHEFVMNSDLPTEETTVQELAKLYKESDSRLEKANILLKLNKISKGAEDLGNFCEMVYVNKFIKDAVDAENRSMNIIKAKGTPWFTPEELLDLGVFANDKNYFSSNPDNTMLDDGITTNQWFDNYTCWFGGMLFENLVPAWTRKMRQLYRDYDAIKESGDQDKIRARQQSILELGWNPGIEFTEENLLMAQDRINTILEMNSHKYDHVDLTVTDSDPIGEYIDDAINKGDVSPVYIILQKGNAAISHAIKVFTGSDYTHASIGFDADMTQNYSYLAGGFSHEKFADYGDDDITVYTFFVKNQVMSNLKNTLIDYKNNAKKSIYDIRKLFDYITDNTKRKASQYAQVCSTFVDNMLKSVGINITKPTRGIVSPKDIEASMNEHKNKIYKVYDGSAKKYSARKTKNRLAQILRNKNFKPLKESEIKIPEETTTLLFIKEQAYDTIVENSASLTGINKMIYETFVEPELVDTFSIIETKLFPAQFDAEGNLLIYKNKLKKLDYAQEFEESNKLCQIYVKNDNIEGLKYELCKLWFMNNSIEKLLRINHNKDLERKELVDCRARILNVFYAMMDVVNKKEKNFNFVEYYNKTPFSDATVKINATTIKYTLATLKSIVK